MIDKDPEQPAFPRSYTADGHNGMTQRDYFAGQALGGLLSGQYRETGQYNFSSLPKEAYAIADAMLEARK